MERLKKGLPADAQGLRLKQLVEKARFKDLPEALLCHPALNELQLELFDLLVRGRLSLT
ncbi:MAG: hypothetical protein Q7S15_00395 [bacterium]|nr:hypothetical protein [bacterium]